MCSFVDSDYPTRQEAESLERFLHDRPSTPIPKTFFHAAKHNLTCVTCDNQRASKYCGRCKFAVYCSKDCQELHWPQHKTQCVKNKTYRRLVKATCKALERIHIQNFLPWMQAKRDVIVFVTDHAPDAKKIGSAIFECILKSNMRLKPFQKLVSSCRGVHVVMLPPCRIGKSRLCIEYQFQKGSAGRHVPLTVLEL
jgi:hypothetical protein